MEQKTNDQNDFTKLLDFSEGNVYMLSAIARTKYGQLDKKDRMLYREVVHTMEELPHALNNLRALSKMRDLKIYIYIGINARSTAKAFQAFNTMLAEYSCQAMLNDYGYKRPITRLDKVWYSALMQPECKNTKYFLIDIDTKCEDVLYSIRKEITGYTIRIRGKEYQAKILLEQETRNGYHFVTTGFEPSVLDGIPDVGVSKDGMLFLEAIGFDN